MKNINLNNFIYFLIGISFSIGCLLFILPPNKELNFLNLAKLIPTIISVDTVIVFLFSKYLWNWRIFKGWLVLIPDLNGTWKGLIHSTWEDPITKQRPNPIPAILTISQSLFSISCVMRTQEMTSYSFINDFILDEDNQVKRLSYSYSSNPKQTVIDRSPQHLGTMIFDINDDDLKREMTGHYWTARKTTGNIEVKFWKKKQLKSFPKNLGIHPVSEIRNFRS